MTVSTWTQPCATTRLDCRNIFNVSLMSLFVFSLGSSSFQERRILLKNQYFLPLYRYAQGQMSVSGDQKYCFSSENFACVLNG